MGAAAPGDLTAAQQEQLPLEAPRTPSLCLRRAVTDSINQLITMCTQQAPGQKECANALRELEVSGLAVPWGGGAGGRGQWQSRSDPVLASPFC